MVYDPARVTEPSDQEHWPLDANVDVVVSVTAASKNIGDFKVRGQSPMAMGCLFSSHSHLTLTQLKLTDLEIHITHPDTMPQISPKLKTPPPQACNSRLKPHK